MQRQMLLLGLGGVVGGALTVLVLWIAGQIGQPGDAEAQDEPVLSAIEAIAVVHQVRGDADETDPGLMREVLAGVCYPEEPDWRAVYLYGKWEITARCTALLESPVWFVTEPDLRIVPYTDAAGRLTQ